MTFLPPSWPSGNEKKARSNKEVSATATTTTYTVEILAGDDRLLKELVKIDNKDVPTIRVESMYELFKDKVQKQRSGEREKRRRKEERKKLIECTQERKE